MKATGSRLDELPTRNGFRMRGLEMTRIETFTDAAFAFAVTLLVVSIDRIPTTYDELLAVVMPVHGVVAGRLRRRVVASMAEGAA